MPHTWMRRRLGKTNLTGGVRMRTAFLVALVVLTAAAAGADAATPASQGRIAFARTYAYDDPYGTLMLVNPNGTGLVTVANAATNPDWSPDGRRLVYQSVRNGDSDLWTVNADGSGSKEITYSVGQDGDPAWSPDGSKIAFESNRADANGDVFVVATNGTGTTRLTTTTGFDGDPAWSPDGRLAFTSTRSG